VLVQEYYHYSNVTKVVNFSCYDFFFFVFCVCLLLITFYDICSHELFIFMFVVEPLNLVGIMTVSRIIENVYFLHGIAVKDCIVVRIFMFLKVFFESM
jgi:hypothetical protein